MNKISLVILVMFSLGAYGCIVKRPASSGLRNENGISCEEGTVEHFTLTRALLADPSKEINTSHEIFKSLENPVISQADIDNIQINVCLVNEHLAKLHSITHQYRSLALLEKTSFLVANGQIEIASGLQEAVFGNSGNLEIKANNNQEAIVIKGWKNGEESFVTFIHGFLYDGKLDWVNRIYYGKLSYGELPNIGEKCLSSWEGTEDFAVGTAKIVAHYCGIQGIGSSKIHIYFGAEITDDNPRLASENEGKSKYYDLENSGIRFLSTDSHHNWCDNFHVIVPEMKAEYAIINQETETSLRIEGKPFLGTAVNYNGTWEVLSTVHSGICY